MRSLNGDAGGVDDDVPHAAVRIEEGAGNPLTRAENRQPANAIRARGDEAPNLDPAGLRLDGCHIRRLYGGMRDPVGRKESGTVGRMTDAAADYLVTARAELPTGIRSDHTGQESARINRPG